MTSEKIINLKKSEYYYSDRVVNHVAQWKIFFNILAVFFISFDTAFNDILVRISHNLRGKAEKVAVAVMLFLYPKMGYA